MVPGKELSCALAAVDRTVYKTRTKDTWHCQRSGVNRFELGVTMEDGCVVSLQSSFHDTSCVGGLAGSPCNPSLNMLSHR